MKLNDKIKTFLSILALLLIGFILGFQTNRYLMKRHLQRMVETRVGPRLTDHLIRSLQLDEAQLSQVKPIVERYTSQLTSITRTSMQRRGQLIDSMHQEIKPLLKTEQIETLDKFSERIKRSRKKRGKKGRKKKRVQQE